MIFNELKTSLSFNGLSVLYNIARILAASENLQKTMSEILYILDSEASMKRGIISILNKNNTEISVDVAHGINESNLKKGIYRPGEGITGRVVVEGRTIIIPKLSEDSDFLNKTGSINLIDDKNVAFICVPISISSKIIGAFSVFHASVEKMSDLNEEARFLEAIADLIAQMVLLRRKNQEHIHSLEKENLKLRKTIDKIEQPEEMIGNSKAIQDVFKQIAMVTDSSATVLIHGVTGTGKELVARAIHKKSPYNKGPFIIVNCAALPESLLESILFGHEKGAFTGASSQRIGQFEAADGGTLFLDEIGEMSLSAQGRLLRAIQQREFQRVGGTKAININVRLVTATNRDLEKEVAEGRFREDLYYRINVFTIKLPLLKERDTDILLLTDYFIIKFSKIHGRPVKRISSSALNILTSYNWPGNIRELENAIERAVLVVGDDTIGTSDLPPSLLSKVPEAKNISENWFTNSVGKFEKELIINALKDSSGNQTKAAKLLGITKRMIQYKINKYNVKYRSYKKVLD